MKTSFLVRFASAILAIAALTPALRADTAFSINVNTTGLGNGFIDFQFNPGPLGSSPAQVTIGHFTGATAGNAPQTMGDVSGTLPSVVIANSQGYNDYFQELNFGTSFNFLLDFSDVAPGALSGSTFALSLYDSNGNPVTGSDPLYGSILLGQVDSGSVVLSADGDSVNPSPATYSYVGSQPIPEPSSLALLGTGIFGVIGTFRRK
jgi:hypothetical protein